MFGYWTKLGLGAAIFAPVALLAAVTPLGAPAIAQRLESAARTELDARNFPWVAVKADGRTIKVYYPDTEDGATATSILSGVPGVAATIPVGIEAPPRQTTPPAAGPSEPVNSAPAIAKAEAPLPLDEPPLAAPAERAETCRAAINRTLNGRRLSFRHDSAILTDADKELLGALTISFGACVGETIIVEGHTDSTGSLEANMRLSRQRADIVAEFIRLSGAPVSVQIASFGETRPIASNQSEAGRQANRRIDFLVHDETPESE